jgi:hypothetical protein
MVWRTVVTGGAASLHNCLVLKLGPVQEFTIIMFPFAARRLAVEELNAMFQAHPDLFQQTPLLSYHSFTRTTKPSVFSKMCSVHSVSAEDVVKGAVAGPLHLRLVLHVLQNVYQGYSDASIVLSSFHTPEWMKLWCNKWGFSTSRRSMTSIYTVNAFPEPHTETRADRQLPVRTMLVPSFSPNFR